MNTLRTILTAALLALAAPALAQPYVGASLGLLTAETSSRDNDSSSQDIILGYRFSEFLSAEAATLQAGSVLGRQSLGFPDQSTVQNMSQNWNLKGYRVSVLGRLPLNQFFALLGRASAVRLEGKFRSRSFNSVDDDANPLTPSIITSDVSTSSSGEKTLLGLGAGLELSLSRSFQFRVMHEYVDLKDDLFGGAEPLDSLRITSFEALYRF